MSAGDIAAAYAYTKLGQPYLWGGTGQGGFDCSGLTQAAYQAAGVAIPRTSQAQWAAGPQLPANTDLRVGDLVFFGPADGPTHVGIFIGSDSMIDAPNSNANIRIENYHWDDYLGATRPSMKGETQATNAGFKFPTIPGITPFGGGGVTMPPGANAIGGVISAADGVAKVAGKLVDPAFIKRVGRGAAGVALLLVGALTLLDSLDKAGSMATSMATSVAKGAMTNG